MKSPEPCEIEALFGSAARRDSDEFSDVDLLIVDDEPRRLHARKRWLHAQGFSVSDYTWRRLVQMFGKQTLFAVHLKQESKTLCDRRGRYRDLLTSMQPRPCYSAEFAESLMLFHALEQVPACPTGQAWALDHLAVSFRNSAILLLSNAGEYVFSFARLLHRMQALGRLNEDDVASLKRLRAAKRSYRAGSADQACSHDVQSALRAVDRVFQLGLYTGECHGPCIAPNIRGTTSTHAYLYLRSVERELISVPTLRDPLAEKERQALLRTVRNPHDYLWKAIYAVDQINSRMEAVRSAY